jgi:hypothetical protein
MNRARLAALLVALWSALQAWFLLVISYYPVGHMAAWGACVLVLTLSVALWAGYWSARLGFLLMGSALTAAYAATLWADGTSCTGSSLGCYARVLSQPLISIGIVLLLLKPLRP